MSLEQSEEGKKKEGRTEPSLDHVHNLSPPVLALGRLLILLRSGPAFILERKRVDGHLEDFGNEFAVRRSAKNLGADAVVDMTLGDDKKATSAGPLLKKDKLQ
jgi:hypothetical protein